MGYYVDTAEREITINKEQFDNCYKAMCKLNDNDDVKRGGGWNTTGITSDDPRPKELNYHPAKWFSWMEANYPDVCKNMEDILHSLGFENIIYNENGDLIGLTYSSKSGQEELFFEAMSPFIVKDSYINWRGEDGELWQWYFDGEKMHTRYATISYQ
jgi:hypothetical protein